jgi:hypothetical protein
MKMRRKMQLLRGARFLSWPLFVVLLTTVFPLWAQSSDDPRLYIGMKLEELIGRFGIPQSVYSARGLESWQDDVVFTYSEGDFYIFKDRVWQASVKSAMGVSVGEPKQAALLALGEGAADLGGHILLPLPDSGWPLALRINLNPSGKVSSIFIYRPDY